MTPAGRQLVSGRDIGNLFFWSSAILGFSRQTSDASQTSPMDFWIWDVPSDVPALAVVGVDWSKQPGAWPIIRVGDLLMTAPDGRLFYDSARAVATDLRQLGPAASQPSYPPLTVIRRDGGSVAVTTGNANVLGVGPPSELQTVPLTGAGAIAAVDFLGSDLALLYAPAGGSETDLGVYRVAPASGALTELVPPAPVADWAGTTGICNPFNALLSQSACPYFHVVGCGDADPPCPGSQTPPCAVVFSKVDPQAPGSTVPYVYDVKRSQTLRLGGVNVGPFMVSPDQHVVVWSSRPASPADPDPNELHYWNACTDAQQTCPFPVGRFVAWHPGGEGFASLGFRGALGVTSISEASCVVPPSTINGGVHQILYSPSGDRLAWVQTARATGTIDSLWLANPDGTSPGELASSSATLGANFSPDGERLFISRLGDAPSLGWLDLTESPVVERLLADKYGPPALIGNRRAMFMDGWNPQDATGDLTFVELDDGRREVLARAVTNLAAAGDIDAVGTNVAYSVRGRAASDRDGLWLTTFPR